MTTERSERPNRRRLQLQNHRTTSREEFGSRLRGFLVCSLHFISLLEILPREKMAKPVRLSVPATKTITLEPRTVIPRIFINIILKYIVIVMPSHYYKQSNWSWSIEIDRFLDKRLDLETSTVRNLRWAGSFNLIPKNEILHWHFHIYMSKSSDIK